MGTEDLFSHADARAARDEGMARVEDHAAPGWGDAMYALVEEVARSRPTFTSDDVFELAQSREISHGTHDRRAFGPVMMRAAREKICRKADTASVPSRRASLHASPRAVWASLIWSGA